MRLLHGLLLAGLLFQPAQKVEVSNDPRAYYGDELAQDVGRYFRDTRCASRRPAANSIRELLGPDLKRVLVHYYAPAWRDFVAVSNYIGRLLDATPENGKLYQDGLWSEVRSAEIIASLEFQNGLRTKILLANGYAHFVDASGCEWWARYFGPDKTKWVVRENL